MAHQTLASVAPLVLPADPSGRTVEGFLTLTQGGETRPSVFWLRLSDIPCTSPTLRGTKLEVNPPLAALLAGQEEVVAARLSESPSLLAFFVELRNLVDQIQLRAEGRGGTGGSAAQAARPAAFFQKLKSELDALGWGRISDLGDDLSSFTLSLHDSRGRQHVATISLPPTYPAAPPTVAIDLPAAFTPRWGPGPAAATLPQLASQLEAALESYQWLWDSLDDVDAATWVIEPLNPPRGATMRRLALGNHVSLAVTLDPSKPGAFPECRFMGSDAAVAPLRQRLHQNRGRWREDRLLRENLEEVLGQELPSREAVGQDQQEDVSAECSICYAYRLPPAGEAADEAGGDGGDEGAVPDINCSNPSCGKPFHRQCLVEWLNADTATRSSFGTLFGTCPYCSDPISVRML